MIFHLTSQSEWERAKIEGEYLAPSLFSEGFIHLSSYGQILAVANSFYKNVENPVLLAIDNTKIKDGLKWEGEEGMEFPHLYRCIRCDEVMAVISIKKNDRLEFVSSEELERLAMVTRIETERLILREFQFNDIESVHAYAQILELVQFMPWGPNTLNETRAFFALKFKEQCEVVRKKFDLAVVDKITGEFLGSGGLMVKSFDSRVGYIGYILKPQAHGKGFATELSTALLNFGFNNLNLNRIEATCDEKNFASYRVMQKIGMSKEGVLRENQILKGFHRNTIICSILKSEFVNI